ncbi:MAG: ABC transporter permease [Bacteroidota bacterium]
MNLIVLSWNYIKGQKLNTLLNTLLLGFGIAIIVVLLLVSTQVQDKFTRNAQGIDMVVGAKGSPLQIILCNIFHIDFPTGNIPLEDAIWLSGQRLIAEAIPLALGDSYKTLRIVGTNHKYVEHYGGEVVKGKLWTDDLQVTLGSQAAQTLGLGIGDRFYGEHGMGAGGHVHEEHEYEVVGILSPSGTALDNLILCNVESVWIMHEEEEEESDEEPEHDHTAEEGHDHHEEEHVHTEDELIDNPFGIKVYHDLEGKEVTALILKYRGPMAAVQLPRMINARGNLQAASPAFEMARLLSIVGIGVDVVQGFAYLIIFIAGLSVFIALYNSLKERRYDLAIMRSMGASRMKLLFHIILEGMIITFLGGITGFILGHGVVELIGMLTGEGAQVSVTGRIFLYEELLIIVVSFALGVIAALIPAITAYRTDISKVLAKG